MNSLEFQQGTTTGSSGCASMALKKTLTFRLLLKKKVTAQGCKFFNTLAKQELQDFQITIDKGNLHDCVFTNKKGGVSYA